MRTNGEADHRIGWRGRLAAVLVMIAIAYPFSRGPATYCLARGWMAPKVFDALYRPIKRDIGTADGYTRWWGWLADLHDPDWRARTL